MPARQNRTAIPPKQNQAPDNQRPPVPVVTVLGRIKNDPVEASRTGRYLVRVEWTAETHQISPQFVRQLQQIGVDVRDNPDDYLI